MQIRRDQGPKSFGRRRPIGASAVPNVGGSAAPVSLLAWSVRVSAIIGVVAIAGAAQLARWNGPGDASLRSPARLTAGAILAPADPETTGTLASGGAGSTARGTHLDPCFAPVAQPRAERLRP